MLYIHELDLIVLKDLEIKFPKVYKAIVEYYCVNNLYENFKFIEYSKNKKISNLIANKIKNRLNLKSQWENKVINLINKQIDVNFRHASFGYYPSYGLILDLSPKKMLNQLEIHIQLSLLGNFYSVRMANINPNMCFVANGNYEEKGYGIEELIVSPVNGFHSETFKTIVDIMEKTFEDALFFPYSLDLLKLKGLSTYDELPETPLGMAFFHPTMPINYYKPAKVVGNIDFGIENL